MQRTALLLLLSLFSFSVLTSCNNNGPSMIIPGTDGINRITIRSIENPKVLMHKATLTAKLYCKSARKTYLAIGAENYDSDSLKQQHIYNENFQRYPMPSESYLEFTCK